MGGGARYGNRRAYRAGIADSPNACFHRGVFGEGLYGTPYIDSECSIGSRLFMIYGHHMFDGSVFADFASFIDKQFASEHDEIIVYRAMMRRSIFNLSR